MSMGSSIGAMLPSLPWWRWSQPCASTSSGSDWAEAVLASVLSSTLAIQAA
jgi:hypothetical protein